MSREEVSAFLRNFQLQLITLHKQIDQGLQKLPEVKREDLPRFLAEQKLRFLRFQQEQMEDWDKFVEETGLQVCGGAEWARQQGRPPLACTAPAAEPEPAAGGTSPSCRSQCASSPGRPLPPCCRWRGRRARVQRAAAARPRRAAVTAGRRCPSTCSCGRWSTVWRPWAVSLRGLAFPFMGGTAAGCAVSVCSPLRAGRPGPAWLCLQPPSCQHPPDSSPAPAQASLRWGRWSCRA